MLSLKKKTKKKQIIARIAIRPIKVFQYPLTLSYNGLFHDCSNESE